MCVCRGGGGGRGTRGTTDPGGTFTVAAISVANVFLLHQYVFGPGPVIPPAPPLYTR